jgi:hypothetical protein
VEALFASGHVADLILVLLGLEAGATLLLAGRRAAVARTVSHIAQLAAAAGLVLALRAALTGVAWPVTAAFLLLAFLAHAASLLASWGDLLGSRDPARGAPLETGRLASHPNGARRHDT